jgi:gamma-glutamyltranspeptidase/glutathione hydrolase
MVPVIMLGADGHFAGAIGSAGGSAILAYVAKSMVAAIDWNLPVQQALGVPNLVARGPSFNGEVTKFSPVILASLRSKGIDLQPGQGEDSGVQAVMSRGGRIDGGADPRREGVVRVLACADRVGDAGKAGAREPVGQPACN